jgi:hypothetical protein
MTTSSSSDDTRELVQSFVKASTERYQAMPDSEKAAMLDETIEQLEGLIAELKNASRLSS